MRDSSLARVSDDFYPALPASHTAHVAVCAFNSLFFGPLVQPDWDMFHSMHPRYVVELLETFDPDCFIRDCRLLSRSKHMVEATKLANANLCSFCIAMQKAATAATCLCGRFSALFPAPVSTPIWCGNSSGSTA
jgi:hypothetical protein